MLGRRSRVSVPGDVILAKHDRVAVATLNRPPSNLVNAGLLTALDAAVKSAVSDDDVSVIVVTGGDKVFSEGLDLDAFRSLDDRGRREFVRMGQDVIWRLEHAPKPTLAAMAGKVLGAGLEIALACDLRLATDSSQFGHPEVTQGLIPLFGDTFRLERLIGSSRARSLIFIGEPIPAWEALEIGLAGKIAPDDVLLEEARITAGRIASQPSRAVQAAKTAMLATNDDVCRKALDAIIAALGKPAAEKRKRRAARRSTNRE